MYLSVWMRERKLGCQVIGIILMQRSVFSYNRLFQFSNTLSANNQLLTRFYASLHAANPALLSASSKRYTIAPPSIHKEGNKKTIFANVTDICRKMHRQVCFFPSYLIPYLSLYSQNMLYNSSLLRWVQQEVSMEPVV